MKYGLLLLIICLIQFSCKKEKTYSNEGVIAGIDLKQCPCVATCPCVCGTLIFHFTDRGDTARVILENTRMVKFPADMHYPVYIKLNWENTTRCNIPAVNITDYKLL